MELGDIFYIVFLAVLPFLSLGFYQLNLRKAKLSIQKYLTERGASNIAIDHEWFDGDRETFTFDVKYTGVKGNEQITRCKVRHWGLYLDSELFWADPLRLELNPLEEDLHHSLLELPRAEYHELSERIRLHLPFELPTYEISAVLPIPNSYDQIVMMKYVATFRNILRCHPDGTMIWQAELPTESADVYTHVEWKDKYLTAFSRSLLAVHLDIETGKILPAQSL